ncbi:hypothetical protein R1flu_027282 [Riccia fluitans]|uniref:Uncharacterized protein n=1 Tax=Riccia fluitans TaxID=41844 RepID=A0ABD1XIC4_9MARC
MKFLCCPDNDEPATNGGPVVEDIVEAAMVVSLESLDGLNEDLSSSRRTGQLSAKSSVADIRNPCSKGTSDACLWKASKNQFGYRNELQGMDSEG